MKTTTFVLIAAAGVAALSMGCKGSPASPFNDLKNSPMMVYRLQNYTPQNQPVQAGAPTQTGTIPGLPIPIPEQFLPQVQQAQTMICGMLPTMPGCDQAAAGQPGGIAVAQTNAPMFEGFRIIGQAQVMNEDLREELIDVFGYEKSFQSDKHACQFPEFGIAFGNPGQSANVMVSYSCNQAWPTNFTWPHSYFGLTDKTVKNLNGILQQLFGGG